MIGFHNVRFPEDISWNSSGGPEFKTQVYESFRGYEKRNIEWSQPVMKFNVAYGVKNDVQMANMLNFFNARQGRAYGFRYKNWGNYRIRRGAFATGDGYSTSLPIWKFYGFQGARSYKRLRKIVRGSVTGVGIGRVSDLVEGEDYNIDYDSGVVSLNFPLGYGIPLYAETLEFDEPVRFDDDNMQIIIEGYNNRSLTDISLIGVKSGFSSHSVFSPNTSTHENDSFYDSTRLILNFDDTQDVYNTVDQSELANPVTFIGSAALSKTTYKHGSGSLGLGATGRVEISGEPFDLSESAFTIEAFVQPSTGGASIQPIIGKWSEVANQKCWSLRYLKETKQLQLLVTDDGNTDNVILSYPWDTGRAGEYSYITIDRSTTGWYVLRINGIVKQSVRYNPKTFNGAVPISIGSYPTLGTDHGPYQANIDSIRITVGRNRYPGFAPIDTPASYPMRQL